MPFRLAALAPAARPASSSSSSSSSSFTSCRRRFFHATPRRRDADIDGAANHYETLKVTPSATPAEIKRSFYNLSKTHHPDQSADPRSSERFVRISEAYNTLSSAERRSRYDRDVLGLAAGPGPRRAGSYSSTSAPNPAGGRPASGLSRRRTAFRGPPPSFYRSGGWGAHGAKRQAAHDESTGGGGGGASATGGRPYPGEDGSWAAGGAGGMGPGQDPFKGAREDVPHFDREGHERTGRRTEEARASRRRTRGDGGEEGGRVEVGDRGQAGMFFVIGGILAASFLVPFAASRFFRGDGPKEKKKKTAR